MFEGNDDIAVMWGITLNSGKIIGRTNKYKTFICDNLAALLTIQIFTLKYNHVLIHKAKTQSIWP